jgi:hypothetical protein
MLMKREEEKKQVEPPPDASRDAPPGIRGKASKGLCFCTTHGCRLTFHIYPGAPISPTPVPDSTSSAPPPPGTPAVVSPAPASSSTPTPNATSLLSILGKAEPSTRPPPLTNLPPAVDVDKIQAPMGSRFFPKPIHQQNAVSNAEKAIASDPPPPPSAQFNPPPGSRLLAFGARPAGKSPALPQLVNGLNQQDSPSQQPVLPNAGASTPDLPPNHGPPKSETLRTGFSPFEDQSRASFGFEEPRDQGAFSGAEPLRRGDRAPFGLPTEASSYVDSSVFDPSSTGYATGKGSRLAKFFDSKGREAQANQNSVGFTSTSPNPGQRHEGGFNPMDGLLSKLNSSAQVSSFPRITLPSVTDACMIPDSKTQYHVT